jgi:hypothetical protein
MTEPLGATPTGSGNPAFILTSQAAPWLTESPDSIRLLGPVWTCSGLTLQAPCRLYARNHWRSGTIAATGETFALIRTSAGLERTEDRRNLQTEAEAVLFKKETAAFRRLLKKRQGGRTNG